MKKPLFYLLVSTLLVITFASCSSHKIVYVQDKSVVFAEDEKDSLYHTVPQTYVLQTDDYLYIKIFSPEKMVEEELRSQTKDNGSNSEMSQKMDYLNGYIVDEVGEIEIPVLGKVFVRGMTEKQAQSKVQEKVDEILINAKSVVKLLNFKVTFLGESNQQGVRYFYQKDVNILEAMASVHGISDYGKLHNVLIMRKKGDAFKTIRLDLTSRNLLSDPNFYLQPNDIVYVEPNRSKRLRLSISDYSLLIGTIASTISSLLIIINFTK